MHVTQNRHDFAILSRNMAGERLDAGAAALDYVAQKGHYGLVAGDLDVAAS